MLRRLSTPILSVGMFFVFLLTVQPARAAEVPVVWTDLVGVSVNGNSLTKTAATSWGNGGAASTGSYTGDFGVRFTAAETNTYRLCGLSDTNVNANYNTIDYAIYLVNNGTVAVHENGVSRGSFGSYQAGDIFKVNRTGTTITYLKNDTVFYTSTIASSGNLLVDTALYTTGATINDVRFYGVPAQVPSAITNLSAVISPQTVTLSWSAPFDNGSPITEYEVQYGTVASGAFGSTLNDDATPGATVNGLTDGTAYQFRVVAKNAIGTSQPSNVVVATPNTSVDVVWASLAGVSANGNTLTKTAGNGWGNAGAVSNTKYSGNITVQFSTNSTTSHWICGLSLGNIDNNYTTVDFGIFLRNNATVDVYESGILKGSFGTYQAGDVFQVERTGGSTINYKKNGVVFYTSAQTNNADMLVDTSLYYVNSSILNVKILGALPGPAAPGIIGDLKAVPAGGRAMLQWSAPSDNGSAITGYDVQYGTVASGAFGSTFNDDAAPGAVITGLTNGTAYQFRAVAKNALGSGGTSNVVQTTPDVITDIVWTDLVGVTASGNTITKTAGSAWGNAGAASLGKYSGNFAIEFPATSNSYHIIAGLSAVNTNANYTSIGYGLLMRNNLTLEVYENGAFKGSFGAYQVGDILRIERSGTAVKYKKNGTMFYTSSTASSGDLLVDTALYYQNTALSGVKFIDTPNLPPAAPNPVTDLVGGAASGQISLGWSEPELNNSPITGYDIQYGTAASGLFNFTFNDDAAPGATITGLSNGTAYQLRVVAKSAAGNSQPSNVVTAAPDTLADVGWTDLVGVTANGNSITKNVAGGWGTGGAASVNRYSGNVAVEFNATQTNSHTLCGLSPANADANYTTIHFGILLKSTGQVEVYENGVSKGIYGTYLTTDKFKVERAGTTITYKKNGTIFYTSGTASSGALIVDAALYFQNTTVANAKFLTPAPAAPGAVSDLAAVPGDRRVNLDWSAPADNGSPITGYEVQYGTVASGAFGTTVQSGSTPGTLITDLVNGTAYQFRVIAQNAIGSGPASNTPSATPDVETEAAIITSPTPNSTLTNIDNTFVWTTGEGVSAYRLLVGTSIGDDDIADSGQTSATVYAVSTIPINGSPVFVRLSSLINSVWVDQDYVYGTSQNPVIIFKGSGSGYQIETDGSRIQSVAFDLQTQFEVQTANRTEIGDIVRYDLTNKQGFINFFAVATDIDGGNTNVSYFTDNREILISQTSGTFEYSKTDPNYRKITFTIPAPPVPTPPYPTEVEFLNLAGTVRVQYVMPFPWNLGIIDNNYIVPASDDVAGCFLDFFPDTYSLLPGDTVNIEATTPVDSDDKLQWQVIPLENKTARAVITPDNARGTSAVISDIRGKDEMLVRVINPSVLGCQKEALFNVGCDECADKVCRLDAKIESNKIDVQIGLGRTGRGNPVGHVTLKSSSPSVLNATPDALKVLTFGNNTETLYAASALRQIVAPDLFADITVLTPYSYEIKYYELSAKGAKVNGFYTVNGGAVPLKTWKIENPDASATVYDRLKITETAGSTVTVSEYIWDGVNGIWTLFEGGSLAQTTYQETTGSGTRTVVETVKDNLNNTAAKTSTTFKEIDKFSGIEEEVIEVVEDPDGDALTTITEWYEDPQDINNFGQIKSVTNPDGSWVKYTYDSLGRVSTEISSWLDETISAPAASARAVYYDYGVQDASDSNLAEDVRRPRKVSEEILGETVSETYYVYNKAADGRRTTTVERVSTPGAAYGAAGNQRTVTVTYPYFFGSIQAGRTESVTYPDGRKDSYTYTRGTYTPDSNPAVPGVFAAGAGTDEQEVVTHGTTASPNGVANKSTREIRITNKTGELLYEITALYDGSVYQPFNGTLFVYDAFGHVTNTYKSDGTQSENTWDCCTLESQTDETGITVDYTYDGLKRVLTQTKDAAMDIETAYTYDAAGRRLSETVTSGTLSLETQSVYDLAGRLVNTTDQAGLVTDYDYSTDLLTTTVTRPGGADEISEQFLDGQAKSVTGTGVVPQYFTYGVNTDGTRWTEVHTGSPSSPNYEKTTTDMLGRTVKVERPGFTGTHTTEYFYNNLGQLIRVEATGQADVLYEYDSLGNQVRSGLDINDNGALNLSSTDRITDTDTVFTFISPDWWQQTTQAVYAADNSSTATTTGIQLSRLTGLGTGGLVEETVAIDIHGNTTTGQTVIDRPNKTQTRSIDYPDSDTNAVSVSVNGLLTSDTSKTNVTTTYAYDGLERQTGVTDPRTGTTTTAYNATTGQVDSVTDPSGNSVSFTYDAAGRKATETNALNDVTRFSYNDRNQVTRTWGDVPYPVEYVYDTYGRVHEMHTWRASAAWNGTTWPSGVTGQEDVTTWNYQEATGLLTSKVDDNAESVAYTYTTAGQLLTRTWARGPVTTYGYDANTAELLTVNYSDSTPDVTFTYDRLGRSKTVADGLGSRTFAYNAALQPFTETISGLYSATITRTYAGSGVVGRPTGFNAGSSYAIGYNYDATGRFNHLEWTVAGASTEAAEYFYAADSDLVNRLYSYPRDTVYTYEPNRNLVTRVQNMFLSGVVSQYDYQYDELGRRTSVANTGSAFAAAAFNRFAYNDRSELNESARYLGTDVNVLTSPVTGELRNYTYDPIGNRTDIIVGTNNGDYTANNLNQYSGENVPGGGSNAFTYDDDGNLTAISGVKNVQYVFDAENRLITAQPSTPAINDKKIDMVYDYQGRRVQKAVSTWTGVAWLQDAVRQYVYDGWNVIRDTNTVGTIVTDKHYVWGLDLSQSLQGAGGIGGLLTMFDGVGSYAYLYDGNGNVGQMVNNVGGAIAAHYEYDPYGNSILATGSQAAGNPYRFSTKYLDTESGLYYYGYRYYDSLTGRWLSRDPIYELGSVLLRKSVENFELDKNITQYVFLNNKPTNAIDYLGLYLEPEAALNGIKAHNLFSEWIRSRFSNFYIANKALESLRRPDLRFKAPFGVGKVWELKPITHLHQKFQRADDRQINEYIRETGFILGDPTEIVPGKKTIGQITDTCGFKRDVILYPGRQGFIYYALGPRKPTKGQEIVATTIVAVGIRKIITGTIGYILGGPPGAVAGAGI